MHDSKGAIFFPGDGSQPRRHHAQASAPLLRTATLGLGLKHQVYFLNIKDKTGATPRSYFNGTDQPNDDDDNIVNYYYLFTHSLWAQPHMEFLSLSSISFNAQHSLARRYSQLTFKEDSKAERVWPLVFLLNTLHLTSTCGRADLLVRRG